jgi:hypothetical protein
MRDSGVRQSVVLHVAVETIDELRRVCEVDIVQGRVFVATELDVVEGMKVVVNVAHPATGDTFLLDAIVRLRRVGGRDDPRGVEVELVGMDRERRAQVLEFAHGGIIIGEAEHRTG